MICERCSMIFGSGYFHFMPVILTCEICELSLVEPVENKWAGAWDVKTFFLVLLDKHQKKNSSNDACKGFCGKILFFFSLSLCFSLTVRIS